MQVSSEEANNSDFKENDCSMTPSCVPKIVMNYVSGSHSTGNSSNLKDKSSTTKKNKRRDKKNRRKDQDTRASVLSEGQRSEVARSEAATISSEPRLQESGWITKSGLAKASTALNKHSAMERADMGPSYTSDEWEADSVNSDTDDDDHTDSSDDDDPKSQVDRLIERGTQLYMEGENSALSSEDESDTDDDDYDSESDITDVSPLVSATASPLGLSPVLPRRTIPTSPLALHDNRELSVEYDDPNHCPFDWDNPSPSPPLDAEDSNESPTDDDNATTSMNLLLQAVIELENQNNIGNFNLNNHKPIPGLPHPSTDQVFIHPIRDNPHHIHLNKTFHRRKNMSFTNEEVRQIDRENKILLKKIMAAHTRKPNSITTNQDTKLSRFPKPTNSATNRKREERIRKENLLLLKKIQEVKPSKDIVPVGEVDLRQSSVGVLKGSMRSPTSLCGAFLRSVQTPHVSVLPPRKETAL